MQVNGVIILAEWIMYAVISTLSVMVSYIYLIRGKSGSEYNINKKE